MLKANLSWEQTHWLAIMELKSMTLIAHFAFLNCHSQRFNSHSTVVHLDQWARQTSIVFDCWDQNDFTNAFVTAFELEHKATVTVALFSCPRFVKV